MKCKTNQAVDHISKGSNTNLWKMVTANVRLRKMKLISYTIAVILLLAALLIPSEVKVQSKTTTQCHMCKAIKTQEYRSVKSIIPVFNKTKMTISGGKPDCKHWWRNQQSGGSSWGFVLRSVVIPLRILLFFIGALTIILTKQKQKSKK